MRKMILIAASAVVIAVLYLLLKPGSSFDFSQFALRNKELNPSSEVLNSAKTIDYYNEQIEKHPEVVNNYIELAKIYLQESRNTGRHHEFIPKATRLIEEALKRSPENIDALLLKASVELTLHKFNEAEDIAAKVIEHDPYNAFAYGVLCDANNEFGNYEKAAMYCDKMLSIRPDLRSYSRASYVRELHGDIKGAIAAMIRAANSGVNGQENRAWVLYNLGNLYLNAGKIDTAAYIFNGILEERTNYAFALAGLSKVAESKGDYAKSTEYLVKAIQSAPEHIFMEQLAGIYKETGQKENENELIAKVMDAFQQHESDGWNVDLEYARFCVKHEIKYDEAEKRIKREYEHRPGNIEVLDIYAWLEYKMNRLDNAVQLMKQAVRLNTNNKMIQYHAGVIFYAANMKSESHEYLAKFLDKNKTATVSEKSYASNILAVLGKS